MLEMDRLASEDHSHIATEEEIEVYRGNWWIRSNLVDSDTMPIRHRLDFKKALLTLHRLKKAEDKAHYENWSRSQALQSDLQQRREFNPFSEESKDAIKAAGNTELCEIVDVEPKSQCRACLTYWDVGIVYCVDTSCEMIRQKTRSISRPCWTSSLSRTSTSGRAGHTVTGTGRKKVAKNSTWQNNFKRGVERNNTKAFTTDLSCIYNTS